VSFRRLITLLTFLAILTMAVRVAVDTDTWWHLKTGEWITDHGAILRTDPFSSTRLGEEWVYPGWLSQVILFQVYRFAGFAGLNMLTALLVLLAFGVLWPRLDAPPLFRGFVLVLAAAASGVYWSARPQIFSFALAGCFLAILDGFQDRDRRWLFVLPVLMVLWANMHGGFAIGFLLLLAYLGGTLVDLFSAFLAGQSLQDAYSSVAQDLRWLLIVLALSLVAVCLNPHGPVMLLYPFKTVSIGVLQQYIQEWQSPDFHRGEVLPFLVMILALFTAFTATTRKVRSSEFLLAAGFLLMGLLAGRNIALFALAGAIPLARHGYGALLPIIERLPESEDLPARLTRPLNAILLALLMLATFIKIRVPLQAQTTRDAIADALPVEAVNYLKDHPDLGVLLNSYNWGGYVIWRLHPDYLSFVDGRTDLFGDDILDSYLRAWRADEGWEQVLDSNDIDVVLLEESAPLSEVLVTAGWEQVYADSIAVILVRPSS